MKPSLLIIGHTLPEPSTTAAGQRMMQLIELFEETGFQIHFATTASATHYSESLNEKGIIVHAIQLNDDGFDEFITSLNPEMVIFDRYITEEQFGWRVANHCPDALRILDTEDLHFLRKAREVAYKENTPLNLYSETAKRELASILRSDLTLIISKAEMNLLLEQFQIPEGLLYYLPLLVFKINNNVPAFEERDGFITAGNFQHAPNLDAVFRLKEEIWPAIRKSLPGVSLHICGAYVPKHVSALHDEKTGFLIQGWTPDLSEKMQRARLCLAPLSFGAGLKGKLLQATLAGTPSVTTSVGAEGFDGMVTVADDMQSFIEKSIALYQDQSMWIHQQGIGFRVLEKDFLWVNYVEKFQNKVKGLQNTLQLHRKTYFISQILQHQSLQASKFLSRWIALKNSKENGS